MSRGYLGAAPSGMLRVTCWCERRIYRIPVEQVGFTTRSCGPGCRRPESAKAVEVVAMPRADDRRSRISANIDTDLAEWLKTESRRLGQGYEVMIEAALRDYRATTERRQWTAAQLQSFTP